MRTNAKSPVALRALLLLAAGLLPAACGGGKNTAASAGCKTITTKAATPAAPASGSWPYSNGDLANTRDAAGSAISSANVSALAPAWTFKLTGKAAVGVVPFGSLTANPIVQNGVVYIQDLDSDVYALALATGKLEWEYQCNQPEKSGPGPNGVAVAGGKVYGLTPTAAFAVSATTGQTIWVNSDLLRKGQGTFGIQPQVADGRVYLASQYGSAPGGGVLLAVNASSGAVLWRFNTVTGPDPGVRALGLGAGGAWETPLVGGDGSVTYGTGNPYQTAAEAIAHPARILYTDSDVNLDAATGKLRWYYQGVPNDFKDYDMQASPVSAHTGGVPVVIGSGKMGYVYEMNATTGKLIWKAPVGGHDGHDNDSLQALEHRSTLKAPFKILPGPIGGVLADLAVAGNTVYVETLDAPVTYTNLNLRASSAGAGSATGEVEALSLATGKVEWDTKVPQFALGAVTVSHDLVFTTLYDGALIALNDKTGAIVYRRRVPTSTNSSIAIAGNTVIVPAGGPITSAHGGGGDPQIVAYKVP
jgi:outer membrane protein assembly factor BamB